MERVSTSVARAHLALLAAPAAILLALACGPDAHADTAAAATDSPAEVREYWTPSRMRAATDAEEPQSELIAGRPDPTGSKRAKSRPSYVPATGPARLHRGKPRLIKATKATKGGLGIGVTREEVTNPAAPEVRMHGKVFFTVPTGPGAGDYVCSGTALNSKNRSVVWTAGHCVLDSGNDDSFATNWTFVPGYSDGGAPYGEWPAKRLATTRAWKTSGNLRYDVGAAVVAKDDEGRRPRGGRRRSRHRLRPAPRPALCRLRLPRAREPARVHRQPRVPLHSATAPVPTHRSDPARRRPPSIAT